MTRYTKMQIAQFRREIRYGDWSDAWVELENGARFFTNRAELANTRADHVVFHPSIGTPITVAIDAVVSVRH